MPLLDLRPRCRRRGDVRAGRPEAADAAADGGPERRAASGRELRRGGRPGPAGSPRGGADDVARGLVRFLDTRSGSAPFLRKTLRYLFPDHWSFLLGEVALYAFIVLVA